MHREAHNSSSTQNYETDIITNSQIETLILARLQEIFICPTFQEPDDRCRGTNFKGVSFKQVRMTGNVGEIGILCVLVKMTN